VKNALGRINGHIMRVEVNLSDENSDMKGGKDEMRCLMEARLEGYRPIAVNHRAMTLGQAVEGAADKLTRSVENSLGRLKTQRDRRTDPPLSEEKLTGGW
jgi:hypothetical protein